MDSLRLFTIFVGIVCVVTGVSAGACYQFSGNGRVSFVENIPFSTSAHFKLEFKTSADSGILYYAEGQYHRERVYDFEGVFMHDGFLHYFLFNPAGPFGIGSSFGFHGKSKKRVNDGNWHKIQFYRNIEMESRSPDGTKKRVYQTGLKLDGKLQAFDDRWRDGVTIDQPIILGGDPHLQERGSHTIGNFKGKIRNFEELTNNRKFDVEHEQVAEVSHCIDAPDAV